jgi:hypothetical protein
MDKLENNNKINLSVTYCEYFYDLKLAGDTVSFYYGGDELSGTISRPCTVALRDASSGRSAGWLGIGLLYEAECIKRRLGLWIPKS